MKAVLISILASAITTKILAAYYFKKIDGYVEEMCKITTKNNEHTINLLHKLERNFYQEV